MNNLSPAALSTLKRELEKRVNGAMSKSKFSGKMIASTKFDSVNETERLSIDEKKFKHELLTMFTEELQESERDMKNAIDGLRRSLTSDFRNPSELRSNSKHRLEFLRYATMKEEQSYNRLKVPTQ